MKAAKAVLMQIKEITSDLVGTEICVDQNFPVARGNLEKLCKIEVEKTDVAIALKRQPYRELYDAMRKMRSYNIRFIDGGLLLLQYQFDNNNLKHHRLGFFPNPDLCDFQNNSEEYLTDNIYIDMMDPRIVTSPIRFDYDVRPEVVSSISHPASHLTIGQYKNCRIPVSKPLMPDQFVRFIIQNFYNTAYVKYCNRIRNYVELFSESITEEEKRILHLNINNPRT